MKDKLVNFEILRIVLALGIVANHIIMYSGKVSNIETGFDYYLTNMFRSFLVYAVNIFILMSGYFTIKFSYRKILRIEIKVLIYTYLFLILNLCFNIVEVNGVKYIYMLFPTITKQYWFISIYFVLCIFSDFINKTLDVLTKKEYDILILIEIIIYYILPTFCYVINAPQIIQDAGYGIVNFVCLYTFGYYIRKYMVHYKNVKLYIILYFVVSLMMFISNIGLSKLLGFYFDSFISYNTIFCLFGSVLIFLIFKNINIIKNKYIVKVSSKCLIVYIIHMNPIISEFLFKSILKVQNYHGVYLVFAILIIPIVIYIICTLIDDVIEFILKNVLKLIRGKYYGQFYN